jgi:hypothetical protein
MCTILLGPGPAVHNFFLVNVLSYQRRAGEGWRKSGGRSRTRAPPLFQPFELRSSRDCREGCEIRFPPRCYYCRRIIWWPSGLVFFRAFWRLHVAHRACVNSVDPRNTRDG